MYRLYLAILASAVAVDQCQPAPPCPVAAWVWASAEAVDYKTKAASAWAAALPCECGGTSATCPCKAKAAKPDCPCGPGCQCQDCLCATNPDGLKWQLAPPGDVNAGRVYYLVKPGRCFGTHCTPDVRIGALRIEDKLYRTIEGAAWGKTGKPPIKPPV